MRGARVASLMCAYNAVDGVPACASGFLMETLARQTWGFEGFVVTDCNAVPIAFDGHQCGADYTEAMVASVLGGSDFQCFDWDEGRGSLLGLAQLVAAGRDAGGK